LLAVAEPARRLRGLAEAREPHPAGRLQNPRRVGIFPALARSRRLRARRGDGHARQFRPGRGLSRRGAKASKPSFMCRAATVRARTEPCNLSAPRWWSMATISNRRVSKRAAGRTPRGTTTCRPSTRGCWRVRPPVLGIVPRRRVHRRGLRAIGLGSGFSACAPPARPSASGPRSSACVRPRARLLRIVPAPPGRGRAGAHSPADGMAVPAPDAAAVELICAHVSRIVMVTTMKWRPPCGGLRRHPQYREGAGAAPWPPS